ncbi:GNAT family N-acetyltransferase [Bacillus carboniphilus]|uniref:GNAT family N-acetyltransferase n=1 Tax=Bacillus carboniphilus TaxID=86663 RepID=A0ABN0WGR5_9BACI
MKFTPWDIEKIDSILKLWNKEIGDEFPLRKELLLQNSFKDENVCNKGSLIAENEDGSVVGFILVKRWQESLDVPMSKEAGWIQVLLVDSAYRGQGIGSKLLEHAESFLKANSMKKVFLGRDPWHYFPGIPTQYAEVMEWFEHKGYKVSGGNEVDLLCDYNDKEIDSIPSMEEVTFSLIKEEEKEDLVEFLNRCFPGRWAYEAIHYFKKGGTGREFAVIKKQEKIIGFCRINDNQSPFIAQNVYWAPLFDEELGGVGPLGVDPNERKKGYGLAIVEAGIAFLRQRGINKIVIDWTGLVDFYGKLGYKPWKTYTPYSKSL